MVDNQHKKITGYRDLTQEEIDLMNRVKVLANGCRNILEEIQADADPDMRWLAIGKTDLQKGFMAVTRSIAKPESF